MDTDVETVLIERIRFTVLVRTISYVPNISIITTKSYYNNERERVSSNICNLREFERSEMDAHEIDREEARERSRGLFEDDTFIFTDTNVHFSCSDPDPVFGK